MTKPPSLTLQQVAEFYGIRQTSILHYETEGILTPFRVGDERYYSTRDRVRIEIILKGKLLGFSLNEIKSLITAHLPAPSEPRGVVETESRIMQLEIDKLEIQAAIDRLSKKIKPDGEGE